MNIMSWLGENGFDVVENIEIGADYLYNINTHSIIVGINHHENIGKWYEEFLVNHGCEYVDIPEYVLCFLHELGHSQTIYRFSETDLKWCSLMKGFTHDVEDYKTSVFEYWNVADELAANEWAVKFINENTEQVIALWKIFDKYWETICNNSIVKFITNTLHDRI